MCVCVCAQRGMKRLGITLGSGSFVSRIHETGINLFQNSGIQAVYQNVMLTKFVKTVNVYSACTPLLNDIAEL